LKQASEKAGTCWTYRISDKRYALHPGSHAAPQHPPTEYEKDFGCFQHTGKE